MQFLKNPPPTLQNLPSSMESHAKGYIEWWWQERLRLGLAPIHPEYHLAIEGGSQRKQGKKKKKKKRKKISKVEQVEVGSGNPGLNRIIPPPPNPHLRGREGTAGGGACARACAGAVRSQRVGRLGLAAWLRERAPGGTHLDHPRREDASPAVGTGRRPGLGPAAFSTFI